MKKGTQGTLSSLSFQQEHFAPRQDGILLCSLIVIGNSVLSGFLILISDSREEGRNKSVLVNGQRMLKAHDWRQFKLPLFLKAHQGGAVSFGCGKKG